MKLFDIIAEKIDIIGLRENIKNLLSRKKRPLLFIVLGLLIVFTISGIIVIAVGSGTPNTAARTTSRTVGAPLLFMHPPLPPAESSVPDDYLLYRTRRSFWDTKEAGQWFTPPNSAMLEQLHSANSAMIHNLLEAAP
jgi:hypothetical protein